LVAVGKALPEFLSFPLCCNKVLWEAPSEAAWEEEYDFSTGKMEGVQLRTLGDLRDVQASGKLSNVDVLDEWNAGVDGLGMLLTVATAPL